MLAISNAEGKRAFALIDALEESEITTSEFAEAIQTLSSEALSVTAAILSIRSASVRDRLPRLWKASLLCRQASAAVRNLC
jgi:hypothetical protein